MRRMSETNVLTLLSCLLFAAALGFGCESKPTKSGGNDNGKTSTKQNESTAKETANESGKKDMSDADTDDDSSMMSEGIDDHDADADEHAADDHEGHDHADTMTAPATDDGLVDLAPLHIERRPSGLKPTNRRDAIADLIYGQMRVQMDVFVDRRKALLEGGADITDPEIRQLEDSIRKAVGLLTENGEYVEAIEPPIEGLELPAGGPKN